MESRSVNKERQRVLKDEQMEDENDGDEEAKHEEMVD